MSEIGALIIRLQAETAQFRQDMGKVKSDLADLGDKAGQAGGEMDRSFGEARGGLMLTEDLIGVRLPRHLNSLIAQIPGVGAAFAAMLPVAGVLVFIDIIAKLIEKHESLAKAVQKATIEADNMAIKEADNTKQLALTNMKLDDQIAKLEHKPKRNYLKETILETSDALDRLAATYAADFQKMNQVIIDQLGLWERFKRGIGDAFSGVGQGKGYGTTTDALHKIQDAMMGVEAARRKMAEAPLDQASQVAAQKELKDALQAQLKAIDAAQPALKGHDELIIQMGTIATATATEIKNLNQIVQEGHKKNVVGALEEKNAEDELYKKQMEGLDKRMEIERRAAEKRKELAKKATEENEKLLEEQMKANEAFQKIMQQQELQHQNAILENLIAFVDLEKNVLDAKHTLGLIGERAYIDQLKKYYQEEHDAQMRYLQTEIAMTQDPDRKIRLQKQLLEETKKYNAEMVKANVSLRQYESTWQDFFKRMRVGTQDLSTQIRVNLQGSINQFTKAFGDDMAKCIVENKNLGQAVRMEAASMLESMISMLIQWLEKWIITHTLARVFQTTTDQAGKASAASLAGANMVASWSAAPWPIDAMAPAMGAAAFGAAMSFEVGGKIPGEGAVPIIGHGGETVVTKALTDRVEAAEGRGSTSNTVTHGDTHNHVHVHTSINAVDASGFEGLLNKHANVVSRHVHNTLRRMNR